MKARALSTLIVAILALTAGTAAAADERGAGNSRTDSRADSRADRRIDAIRRAQVWLPTDVTANDIGRGGDGPGGFEAGATVPCDYVDKKLSGRTPKFACRVGPDEELKVKFGGTNGEVYAEVAATRLLWALGFVADRMFPVKILCHGCPASIPGIRNAAGDLLVDPASVERRYPGDEVANGIWSWPELELVAESAGGAPQSHRDALKLLAALLQHTDSKAQQQRLLCLDDVTAEQPCERPVMMISDLGRTFGRASRTNANFTSSMNLRAWAQTPTWKSGRGCVANLSKSFTGTLSDPVISEAGRSFLADLLAQLSDQQLHDLFTVARVELRPRSPENARSGFPSVDEWVDAFKQKRAEITDRRCD